MHLTWFYLPLSNCVSYFPHPSLFLNTLEKTFKAWSGALRWPRADASPLRGWALLHGTAVLPACQKKFLYTYPQCHSSELVLLLIVGGEPLAKRGMNHLQINIKLVWKWNQKNWVNADSPPLGRQSCFWVAAEIPLSHPAHAAGVFSACSICMSTRSPGAG